MACREAPKGKPPNDLRLNEDLRFSIRSCHDFHVLFKLQVRKLEEVQRGLPHEEGPEWGQDLFGIGEPGRLHPNLLQVELN